MAVAGTWVAGGLASGPLHLGWIFTPDRQLRRPVATPLITGVAAFGTFYAAALVTRRVPVLDRAIRKVMRYAHQGSTPLVATTALVNGVAEEVFFRGAVYAAVGVDRPVLTSTAVYGLATVATRNPALVLASLLMSAILTNFLIFIHQPAPTLLNLNGPTMVGRPGNPEKPKAARFTCCEVSRTLPVRLGSRSASAFSRAARAVSEP